MNNHTQAALMLLAAASIPCDKEASRHPIWTDEEIISEYELIQQKKSKLPRSKRDQVVRRYNHLVRIPTQAEQPQETKGDE